MGLLDRLINGLNRGHDKVTDIEYKLITDRRYGQAERLAAEGVSGEGVLTGIKQRFEDGTTNTIIRISWFTPAEEAVGLLCSNGSPLFGFRLGATVPIRSDGDRAVLDWARVCQAWGPRPDPSQRRTRFVPDDGCDDTAQDARVLSRLKKWNPQRAIVESFERRRALGMLTDNWDVVVRCSDGAHRTVAKNVVPWYAAWFVVPGADVPVVVDPNDAGRAEIDWQALALDRATAGGRWQEKVPAGSLAEAVFSHVEPQQQAMSVVPQAPDLKPADGALAPIEGVSLQQWATMQIALQKARVAPAHYDAWATEQHGVAAGRYTAIDKAWNARMTQDWRIGAAMGEALEAARKAAKKR